MTEAATETPTAETKEPKTRKRGTGTVIKEALAAGKTNEQALEAALAEFPEAKTTLASVSWYRNEARKADPSVLSARDVKKAQNAAATDGEPAPEAPAEDPLA